MDERVADVNNEIKRLKEQAAADPDLAERLVLNGIDLLALDTADNDTKRAVLLTARLFSK